jgi:hypothetical protein
VVEPGTDGLAIEVGEWLANGDCHNDDGDEEETINTSIDQEW